MLPEGRSPDFYRRIWRLSCCLNDKRDEANLQYIFQRANNKTEGGRRPLVGEVDVVEA